MTDGVLQWLLSSPSRLMTLGSGLIHSGSLLLLVGMAGRVLTAGASTLQRLSTKTPHDVMLGDIVGAAWTSVVPEGPLGFGLAVLLIVAGFIARHVGRLVQRLYEG